MPRVKTSYAKARKNPKWNGGFYMDSKGYIAVNVGKGHPLADSKGYCRLHTLVWCAAGKQKPDKLKNELLHHIDEDKANNMFSNLVLLVHDEHQEWHTAISQFRAQQEALEEDAMPPGLAATRSLTE